MRNKILFAIIFIIIASYLLLSPVYQFYAHRGDVPMPFWNYQTIPDAAPSFSQVSDQRFESIANQAIKQLEQHRHSINSPAISAAIAVDGKLVWSGGSGWANLKKKQPVTADTQFRIGSTSKALTSTLLARLVQQNKINLDTSLDHLSLGELNPAWSNITPRQLASHTAGLPHYKGNSEWYGLYKFMALNQRYDEVLDAVKLFNESELLFQPGEEFSYSSLGTVLLSAAIEEAGGQSYQALINQQVLQPLDMTDTQPEPESHQKPKNLAEFYWRADESKPRVRPWRDVDLSHRLAGGGFISTPEDLVKLGLGFIDNEFLNENTRQTFWTPQTLNNGEVNHQRYAIGWRVHKFDMGQGIGEVLNANHGGVSRGSQSWLMVIPEHRMAVAVNINTKTEVFWDFGSVSTDLAKLFLQASMESAKKESSEKESSEIENFKKHNAE
ncbi:serine hydrolase domain-containing protein [Pleionea mediterranea]|uniref:CubicO group peptidase (Beta-lactamase class C family) n=1 Tax=Pleionea mediterranea TaxID=523701 RepID=A0A316FHH9_9GAMM|nr:serine hydrolase domain-containing protein [Pleionea mediterranea]PWK47889.1 CubicO group peptidase (beta-lactamase class C family) [Pleionea mediterranea]